MKSWESGRPARIFSLLVSEGKSGRDARPPGVRTPRIVLLVTLGAALVAALAAAPQPAAAQSVEQFYRGRTVTLVVGTSPGGVNDLSSRLVARHLGRFIPGNPSIIVQNMPGFVRSAAVLAGWAALTSIM